MSNLEWMRQQMVNPELDDQSRNRFECLVEYADSLAAHDHIWVKVKVTPEGGDYLMTLLHSRASKESIPGVKVLAIDWGPFTGVPYEVTEAMRILYEFYKGRTSKDAET